MARMPADSAALVTAYPRPTLEDSLGQAPELTSIANSLEQKP